GGICFVCIIYTYFCLPEPNGRTFAELGVCSRRASPLASLLPLKSMSSTRLLTTTFSTSSTSLTKLLLKPSSKPKSAS
ncbi:hypothetical protein IL306_006599, partial [Fusarium sp. DS 682]